MTTAARASLPPSFVPSALAEIVVLSDFWSPMREIRTMLAGLSASGAHGTLVQIVDPAEETFPYSGRVEFVEPEGGARHHRRPRRKMGRRLRGARRAASRPRSAPRPTSSTGCSRPTPPTAPPPNCCCSCMRGMMVSKGSARGATRQSGATRMIAGLPLAFAQPLMLLGLLSLPVLWWLLRVMPPRPRRIEFPPTRLLFDIAPKEETPVAHAVVADAAAAAAAALVIFAAAGPIWNPQTGVAGSSAPLVMLLDDGWSAAASWDTRDQGRRRTDRERRQRPPRRRAGAAVGAGARHHA